ncbi:MAG: GTP-binding protein, partial [Chloroflexus sp.]
HTPLVIAANKADLTEQRRIANDEIAAVATQLSADWLCTSARTGAGVNEAFQLLGRQIVQQKGRV